MLNLKEFLDRLKDRWPLRIDGEYIYIDGLALSSRSIYERYYLTGMTGASALIEEILDERALLERLLDYPKDSDIYPVIAGSDLTVKLYAHLTGKYISRMKEADGDIEKAKKNLKKRYPAIYTESDGIIFLHTRSPYLAASHILLEDFSDSFILIPNQGLVAIVKPDSRLTLEQDRELLKKAMYTSGASIMPPAKQLNIIIPPNG